jgi:hypothetical protein
MAINSAISLGIRRFRRGIKEGEISSLQLERAFLVTQLSDFREKNLDLSRERLAKIVDISDRMISGMDLGKN